MPRPVKAIAVVSALLELVATSGYLIGAGDNLRQLMLAFGAFWPGLLSGSPGLFPGQAVTMFATSPLLHGGLLHLFMNMVALLWLGPIIIDRAGQRAFWPIVGLSALGSGAMFAALSQTAAPMVGASGVLFGFIGVVAVWDLLDRIRYRAPLRPLIEQAAVFVALNVALMLLAGGAIAWQAHLGGLLAGLACGFLTWPGAPRYQLR